MGVSMIYIQQGRIILIKSDSKDIYNVTKYLFQILWMLLFVTLY